jgi:catalase (peroxidase I)
VNFRGGRIDAKKAGPPGVPGPDFSLPALKQSFARQGFTPTEMIQLVACGHTLGGVTRKDFPSTVPQCKNAASSAADEFMFDTSSGTFDNKVCV